VLYGREAELAAIDDALVNARARRGRVLCFVGEPGIGKSALLAAARTRANGTVLEGAAWESPGAPPYWPWIQVLRTAEAEFGPGVHALPGVARLLGETDAGADAIEPGAARFALLDQIVRALVELAAQRPLVIVLDDLHAADLPSLELLDLACREIARTSIAIIAAWRDGELATRPDAARRLARVGRQAIALRRLSAAEVTAWVGGDGGAIHAASEGNPLFVEELVRARRAGTVPRGIATVLEDHLALVSADTRAVLAAGSVLGRELAPELLAVLAARDDETIERALREASDVGLGEMRDSRWVFRHVLVRDHLYEHLPASERVRVHRVAGEALAQRDGVGAAHHLLAGNAEHAVDAARDAAARAFDVYAFEDAAALLAAALRALETRPGSDPASRIDLRLALARARAATGHIDASQTDALRAAELAKAAGDSERFALAALAYSNELASGRRDPVMLELLEAARAGLPPVDSALLARVLVRLAAALVPTPDFFDNSPYELANDAVAMADRVGDDAARMYTRRFAAHARGFRAGIAESLADVREAIALSDRLGRQLEVIEHRSWLINAHLVMGDLAGADAHTESFAALLGRLSQPQYRWRMPIVRAARAILRGDFDEAFRLIASARQLARDHDLDRARMCCSFAELSAVLASRSRERALECAEEVRAQLSIVPGIVGKGLLSSALAAAGKLDEARRELAPNAPQLPPIGLMQFRLEAALLLDDRERIATTCAALADVAGKSALAYGAAMSVMLCPIEIAVGEGLVRIGRAPEAVSMIERGLALARMLEAPVFVARGAAVLADALAAVGIDRARVATLRDEAHRRAGQQVMVEPAERAGVPLAIARDGDHAIVRWKSRELRVPPSKGLDYLAVLIARPSGEVHVSELVGDDDRGDAGEVLDASARAAYKARVDELREELAEAQARNDLGRIDRLTAELEMITDQVVSATGLGGRSRRAGSRVERARVNVQRRIRDAIQRLAALEPLLGRYLEATIRTGTFCSFTPLDE
jgi:hypothetical protein